MNFSIIQNKPPLGSVEYFKRIQHINDWNASVDAKALDKEVLHRMRRIKEKEAVEQEQRRLRLAAQLNAEHISLKEASWQKLKDDDCLQQRALLERAQAVKLEQLARQWELADECRQRQFIAGCDELRQTLSCIHSCAIAQDRVEIAKLNAAVVAQEQEKNRALENLKLGSFEEIFRERDAEIAARRENNKKVAQFQLGQINDANKAKQAELLLINKSFAEINKANEQRAKEDRELEETVMQKKRQTRALFEAQIAARKIAQRREENEEREFSEAMLPDLPSPQEAEDAKRQSKAEQKRLIKEQQCFMAQQDCNKAKMVQLDRQITEEQNKIKEKAREKALLQMAERNRKLALERAEINKNRLDAVKYKVLHEKEAREQVLKIERQILAVAVEDLRQEELKKAQARAKNIEFNKLLKQQLQHRQLLEEEKKQLLREEWKQEKEMELQYERKKWDIVQDAKMSSLKLHPWRKQHLEKNPFIPNCACLPKIPNFPPQDTPSPIPTILTNQAIKKEPPPCRVTRRNKCEQWTKL